MVVVVVVAAVAAAAAAAAVVVVRIIGGNATHVDPNRTHTLVIRRFTSSGTNTARPAPGPIGASSGGVWVGMCVCVRVCVSECVMFRNGQTFNK